MRPSCLATAVRVDDAAFFETMLTQWGVGSTVQAALKAKGFDTLSLVAHALPQPDQLESFVVSILGRPAGAAPEDPVLTPDAAALRRVVKESCRLAAGPSAGPSPLVQLLGSAKPKFTLAEVTKLIADFSAKYPSEFLRPDSTPSVSLLLRVKEGLDNKCLSWTPWRLRTSEQEVSVVEQRRPRTDMAMLASLLAVQETGSCEAHVPTNGPVEPALRKFVGILRTAIALLDGMHLLPLKKMLEKFVMLATQVPQDKSLRCPMLQKVIEADKVLWAGIAVLQAEHSWSLADAVAEMTQIRPDLHAALAPRVKSQASESLKRKSPLGDRDNKPRAAGKAAAKSAKKGGNNRGPTNSGKSGPKVSLSNWARQVDGAGPCIRFHTAKCRNSKCRFSHKCPILMADGTPCGKDHSAATHSKTPH